MQENIELNQGSKLSVQSVFESRTLESIYDEIQQIYLGDNRPWILGFSGGKDSTCMTQLIWNALIKLAPKKRQKPIFIISSDTLVESPKIYRTNYRYFTKDGISCKSKKSSDIYKFGKAENRR